MKIIDRSVGCINIKTWSISISDDSGSLLSPDGPDCKICVRILEELETIDDDTDKHNIQFVKSTDAKLASEYGIFDFPALVFFDTGVPIMYGGKSIRPKGS